MTVLLTAIGSAVGSVASGIGSAFSSLGGLISGAGTAAPAAGAAATASSGISIGSILQGGLGLVSAMGAMRQGQAAADTAAAQAGDTRLEVTQESLDAMDRQTSLRKQLVQALGERDVAYAASGVDLSFGTPDQARREAIASANDAISVDQSNSEIRKQRLRARAFGYEAQGADALAAGRINAIGGLLNTGIDLVGRG